ncbi:MAG: hypothetical protein WDM81_06195 [Rhizomicrobium sp.]
MTERDNEPVDSVGVGKPGVRPAWRRPEVTVLDVESGTLATVGSFSDGTGSTS